MSASESEIDRQTSRWRRRWAWLAHAYTSLGLVLAAGMVAGIFQGDAEGFRWAFIFMLIACLIDATDGTLARRLKVKELLPEFDGAKLDDLIDFVTFTSLPLTLIWRAHMLPVGSEWILVVALVASAYGFCQTIAKTSDGYFVGFPSYWNIVAFYLYTLHILQFAAALIVLGLALLTFVPSYYLYPSRGARLSRLTNFLGGVWVALLAWILWSWRGDVERSGASIQTDALAWISFFYPLYYMVVSWWITIHRWKERRDIGSNKAR